MLNNNRGAALVQILIVLLLLSLLGTFFISLSTTEYWMGERDNKEVQAYYYARSGVDAVFRLYMTGSQGTLPFYLYGSMNRLSKAENLSGVDQESQDIITEVTASGNEIIVKSTGNYKSVTKTLSYVFTYTPGGAGGGSGPVIPPTNGVDGISGGPEAGALKWYDTSGEMDPGGSHDSPIPVIFDSPSSSQPFIYKDENSSNYSAPSTYFLDYPDSLKIRENMELRLLSDFASFRGDIDGFQANNENNTGILTLNVRVSQIDGGEIGGIPGTKYGVVFLGGRLKNTDPDTGDVNYLSDPNEGGFYYFQSGIRLLEPDLPGKSSNNTNVDIYLAEKKLVKIDDVSSVNQSRLGATFFVSGGGISDGQFK